MPDTVDYVLVSEIFHKTNVLNIKLKVEVFLNKLLTGLYEELIRHVSYI